MSDWQPQGSPVFTTNAGAMAILRQYRRWYEAGYTDAIISELIRSTYTIPHNPKKPWDKTRTATVTIVTGRTSLRGGGSTW